MSFFPSPLFSCIFYPLPYFNVFFLLSLFSCCFLSYLIFMFFFPLPYFHGFFSLPYFHGGFFLPYFHVLFPPLVYFHVFFFLLQDKKEKKTPNLYTVCSSRFSASPATSTPLLHLPFQVTASLAKLVYIVPWKALLKRFFFPGRFKYPQDQNWIHSKSLRDDCTGLCIIISIITHMGFNCRA